MAGKIQISDELKKDLPQSKWGKTLGATPIVMTVIATMLAGLASSEMTKAQYDRSAAAQLQSKAGDQWGYFQAKKLRSAISQNSFELMEDSVDIPALENDLAGQKFDYAGLNALYGGRLPEPTEPKFDDDLNAALAALGNSQPESEIAAALAKVSDSDLAAALIAAQQSAADYDGVIKKLDKSIDDLHPLFLTFKKDRLRSFNAARFRYQAARYDNEARLNQTVAYIYELQVRKGNLSAERHHRRSGKFFFGMLASQMGVIIATFALAARQKSFLWSLAAAAGLAALSFSLYVFLYV
jgi:Domain of unknown function (DUF4337)